MKNIFQRKLLLLLLVISAVLISCNENDDTLAPYVGSPGVSGITVEEESFKPKVTWIGGYVSVFGVNRGERAALDTSLVWLIKTDGNNIQYPVIIGDLPSGAQDITSQYGGTSVDSLNEDEVYTFWVLKEDVWNQVSVQPEKAFIEDSLTGNSVTVTDDTVSITTASFRKKVKPINVYINILNVRMFGPLAEVFVETTTLNVPRISWRIKAAGADTTVAAIGMAKSTVYDASNALWEVYSERDSAGTKIYVKDNVIAGPVLVGESIPGTRTFVEFNPENFERNAEYHVWIADKSWDRENRQRFTPGYAYTTFRVE